MKTRLNLITTIFIIILLTCLLAGCSGGDGVTWPGTGGNPAGPIDQGFGGDNKGKQIANDPRAVIPTLGHVNCIVDMPEKSKWDASALVVQGFMDSDVMSNPADDLLTATGVDNMLFLIGPNKEVVGVAYVEWEEFMSGSVEIGVEELCDGLIMMNPFLYALTDWEKRELLWAIHLSIGYSDYIDSMTAILRDEPWNAMNSKLFPGIFRSAMSMGYNALEARFAQAARDADYNVGTNNNIHLEDLPGYAVDEVNPRMCFYGSHYTNSANTIVHLVGGKSSDFDLWGSWPPGQSTPPFKETLYVPEGQASFDFYKGLTNDDPRYSDLSVAQGRATYANAMKFMSIIIDAIFTCELDNESIVDTISAIGNKEIDVPGDLDFSGVAAGFGADISVWEKMAAIMPEMLDEWDKMAYYIFGNLPTVDKDNYIGNSSKSLDAFTKVLDNVADIILEQTWANREVPFFFDLFNAPGHLKYVVNHNLGVVSHVALGIEPSAAFVFAPPAPKVDVGIIFAPVNYTDDLTPPDALLFRWDVHADHVYETDWQGINEFVYTFHLAGAQIVKLEVKDTDGYIGSIIQSVYVASPDSGGTSNHLKFFGNRSPWDSDALFLLAEQYGVTPGQGPYHYEVFASSKMSLVDLIPGQDLIIILNDQDQEFYNDLAFSLDRFERFVQNGGTIFWGACDLGWGEGSMLDAGIESLPGGVGFTPHYDHFNYNVNPTHPVMAGLPSELFGNYASHEYFENVPPETIIFTTDSEDRPTLIEYNYGLGQIIASGLPLEHAWKYGYDAGPILPRLVQYILGLEIVGEHSGASFEPGIDGEIRSSGM